MRGNILNLKVRYSQLALPVKAALWFTVCSFCLKGISFICMPLYIRILPTDEYGKMSVLTSYETIFMIFATFELYLGAYQRGLLKFKENVKEFEWSIVFFSNILTCICLALVCIFNKSFVSFTGVSVSLYLIMSVYFLGYAPYNCWLNKKRFNYDYKVAVIVTIVATLLANLFPIITVNIFGRTAFVKVASTLLISTLFYLPFWIKDFHPISLIKKSVRLKEYAIYVIKFQGPLVFHSLSYYILNQSDRIMIEKFGDSTSVAYYSVAYSLATVIILVQTSLNQVLKPWRFKKLEEKRYEDVRKNSNMLIMLIGLVIIVFMLIVPEVFKILVTENYYESLTAMPPITISVFFLFLYTIFVDIESYYGKTSYIAYVSTFCAILNVVLNYFGLQFFNYTICAYTTLICYALMSFLHYLFMLRTCRKAGVDDIPVKSKFIWLFSLVMLVAFFVIDYFYESLVIRYFILAIVIMMIVAQRKRIFECVKLFL